VIQDKFGTSEQDEKRVVCDTIKPV